MKKHYFNPSMEVIEIQEQCNILDSSITDLDGNTDIEYGGGGVEEPMARKFNNIWENEMRY